MPAHGLRGSPGPSASEFIFIEITLTACNSVVHVTVDYILASFLCRFVVFCVGGGERIGCKHKDIWIVHLL